ncbi:MAG: hypothetical protein JSR58_05740 [Verrucomicrobia bacterium]|nr:hypothetical protein [Verrucomicrobiota bacterium]
MNKVNTISASSKISMDLFTIEKKSLYDRIKEFFWNLFAPVTPERQIATRVSTIERLQAQLKSNPADKEAIQQKIESQMAAIIKIELYQGHFCVLDKLNNAGALQKCLQAYEKQLSEIENKVTDCSLSPTLNKKMNRIKAIIVQIKLKQLKDSKEINQIEKIKLSLELFNLLALDLFDNQRNLDIMFQIEIEIREIEPKDYVQDKALTNRVIEFLENIASAHVDNQSGSEDKRKKDLQEVVELNTLIDLIKKERTKAWLLQ